ncbi:MAG: molybdopterin-dependent oxidoreductase [Candidatus Acidiferrales bacterium]
MLTLEKANAGVTANHQQDSWIPSSCSLCYGNCSILAHNVDGVLAKIEGNPVSACGEGRLCAKGVAGIMTLYDPNRVNVPLKRTNPTKGIGVDPGWVEISWEEALDIAVKKLKEVHDRDPGELFLQGTTTCASEMHCGLFTFAEAFGANAVWVGGGGIHCGSGAHEIGGLMHASWSLVPDFKFCNYAIYFGASKGHSAGHVANQNAQLAADARARGMKMVVVDPMCNFAAGKGNEWVPIRVGTDAALALAMANVLVNELGIYDGQYLKQCTNAAYLVKEDGHYVRDAATNKPLVWDATAGTAKTFDSAPIDSMALLGTFTVNGGKAQPGFQILKEHLKKYTPEYSSGITTIAAANIRRMAREFGEAARIGSTIMIDGEEYPYRPAAAIFFRGSQGHKNSTWNCVAIDLLNQLVGSADNVGGALGFNPVCHGHPDTGRPYYVPEATPDGLMITGTWMHPHKPFPANDAAAPTTIGMREFFPWAMTSPFYGAADREKWWNRFNIQRRPRVMINFGANAIMSVGNKDVVAEAFKDVFIISFDIFKNEMTDFADVVLPDTCYLERLFPSPNYPFIFNHPGSMGTWSWPIRQPVVKSVGERRDFLRVMYEIGYRMGLLKDMNGAYNMHFELKDPYRLEPDVKYEFEEIVDRALKSFFGEGHGLEWFKENGVMNWPKKAEEVYWRSRVPVRVPVYFEIFQTTGEQVRQVAKDFGIENEINYQAYQTLPDWNPCPSHECKDPQYDLISFYYRDTVHTNSLTLENPWLDEAAQMNDYSYNIAVNAATAKRKGLNDGDIIWVESNYKRRVKGRLKTIEGIHPEGIGIAALAGHWSKDLPIAKGKGVFYNELIEVDYDHLDPGNLNMDLCVKVRIYKA